MEKYERIRTKDFISRTNTCIWYFIAQGGQTLSCRSALHSRCKGETSFWPLLLKVWAKKILGMALETSTWLSMCVTTDDILAPYFTYRSPLLMEYFFPLRETPNFPKFHQSFINSFRCLENCFSWKIIQKKTFYKCLLFRWIKWICFLLSNVM